MPDEATNGVYDDEAGDVVPDPGPSLNPAEYDDDDAVASAPPEDQESGAAPSGDVPPDGGGDRTTTTGSPSTYGEGDLISLGSVVGIPAEEVSAYYRTYGADKTADRIRELLIDEARKIRDPGKSDAEKAPAFAIDLPEYDPEKNPQGIDPALKSALNQQLAALHAHHESKNKELREVFSNIQRALAVREQHTREQAFEQRIGSLGEEYAELLGRGSGYQLDRNGPQFKNRVAVYRNMEALRAAGVAENEEDLFRSALHAALATELESVVKRRIASELKQRSHGAVGRPNKPSGPIHETREQKEARIKAMLEKGLRGELKY